MCYFCYPKSEDVDPDVSIVGRMQSKQWGRANACEVYRQSAHAGYPNV